MKIKIQPPRTAGFNRFQTAISGIRQVHTVMDAQFDPYAEPCARPAQTLAAMETIPPVKVSDAS